jgi:hypothetical protein
MSDTPASAPVDSNSSAPIETPVEGQKDTNPFAGTLHKVKLVDREMEIPYEELISDYQQKASSQKRFQEAARIKKEVDEFVNALQLGDLKRLKGVVPAEKLREFAEQELLEYIQYEQMPEADKKRLAAEMERDQYRRELEEKNESEKKAHLARIEEEAHRELDLELSTAIKDLKTELGIDPKKPVEAWFVDHIARLMLAHLEADETASRMPAKEATNKAWKGVEETVRSYLDALPPQKVVDMLPLHIRDAIRKNDVGDAVSQIQKKIRDKQTEDRPVSKKDRKESTDDFFERLSNRFGS